MSRSVLLALLAAAAAACAPVEDPGATFVRLHNASPHALDNVRVNFGEGTVAYGNLAPGQVSDYRLATGAYRYARLEARIGGAPYVLQPIDYVGETRLAPGRYTYRLEARTDERGVVIADAVRDD